MSDTIKTSSSMSTTIDTTTSSSTIEIEKVRLGSFVRAKCIPPRKEWICNLDDLEIDDDSSAICAGRGLIRLSQLKNTKFFDDSGEKEAFTFAEIASNAKHGDVFVHMEYRGCGRYWMEAIDGDFILHPRWQVFFFFFLLV
jgi:hypothetical protein